MNRTETVHILASADRQIILDELLVREDPIPIEALSRIVASRRHKLPPANVTETRVEQAQSRLVHKHLPELADSATIDIDWSSETVTLCEGDSLQQLLETAAELDTWPPTDLQGPTHRQR
ncbi:DUF7344 domain-containing protein [Natronolimnobius baerhuensis]|uniref:DUF7344 domain-containing protein n=1 Tax=Natronolimnobius baerhuensis TaxID=253108 RepID=A0A202EB60_9EURY|nr:hypothetical protein [Natronolimnobius baerhuensis]OVE85479.1 hypothetical protein B2G88_01245 [Natronolimnobius baerhuensis]